MYMRVSRVEGLKDVSQILEGVTQNTIPVLKQQPGYVGAFIVAEPGTEVAGTVTFWQDRQAVEASEAVTAELRAKAGARAAEAGARITETDVFEILMLERTKAPEAGAFIRVNDLSADAARIDQGLAFVRDKVHPAVRNLQGFRSISVSANRESGRTLVGTTWDTLQDLKDSEAAVADLRQEGVRAAGASGVRVEVEEILWIELPTGAAISS